MSFDFSARMRSDLPAAAGRWNGFPAHNLIGGHNDAPHVPVDGLRAAADRVLAREGATLATYGLQSGPLGYRPLRDFIAAKLKRRAGMAVDPDDILVTSGSLQALDLVNWAFLESGDTVIVEEATYGGTLTRLQRLGVNHIGTPVDGDGIIVEALAELLDDLAGKGVKPKFVYTVPTVQNPTGGVMTEARRRALLDLAARHDLMIFEDDCYADLLWEGARPPAIHALDTDGRVIYCGSFSKSIAPALRVGYLTAPWDALSRMLPLKTDAGSGALEQMVLAEYAPDVFDDHVTALCRGLKEKAEATVEALEAHFGTSAEFAHPRGGIFLWVTLPEAVDTTKLAQVAGAEGVAINPGAEWVADPATGRNKLRICFANPDVATLREGIGKLAEICHREFGVPVRSANVVR
jgi:2-aminoadipate transaminase